MKLAIGLDVGLPVDHDLGPHTIVGDRVDPPASGVAQITDARRKAEVYARASGVQLGRVEMDHGGLWISPPVPMMAQGASAAMAATTVPIATGKDRMRVRVTVGFEIAR